MKKNLKATSILSGCISLCWLLMMLTTLISKQDLYLSPKTKELTTEKIGKKVSSNYTWLALLILSGSIPLSIMANLVVSNRLPEVELEAEEYNKQKMIRRIRRKSELETERELCNANKTVTVTAHEKDLESAFIDLAEASNWHYVSEDEDDIRDSTQIALSPLNEDNSLKKNS